MRSLPRRESWRPFVALLACAACAPESEGPGDSGSRDSPGIPAAPISFVDAEGHEHRLAEPARRIVSLVPSATHTLHAIGADGSLVGRTDFDTAAWASGISSVGGGLEPSLEALVVLEPDLVLRFGGEQDLRTPAQLDELGITHVAVRPVRVDDIFTTTRIVGLVSGRAAAADSLVVAIRHGLEEVEASARDLPRLRVAYVLGGSPPWVAGPETFISEILTLAGGDNVFSDLGAPYAAVSPEELRTREIDVVLVSAAGALDPSLVPGARVEVIDGALENPGPGVVEAARSVARLMHGTGPR